MQWRFKKFWKETRALNMRNTVASQFSHSVMSDSLWPHGPWHVRPPCLSPTPRVYSNSCPSSQWSHPLSSPSPLAPSPAQHQGFSNESTLRMRWPKYWSFSFSISPSNEHPGLISFRMDWLDVLAVQGTLEFSPIPQFKSIHSSGSSQSNSHIHTWPLEKPQPWLDGPLLAK